MNRRAMDPHARRSMLDSGSNLGLTGGSAVADADVGEELTV
jgi:hypothetical protein